MNLSDKSYIRLLGAITALLVMAATLNAQNAREYIVVRNLQVIGNKHTESRVVLRELDVFPGDTIYLENLATRLQLNRNRLLSTALFTDVVIDLADWAVLERVADIKIMLQENWYLYPSIIFELADRNFNVWWKEMNRSLDRVNYGLRMDHINLTGNRDRFKAKVQFGYTRKFELNYDYPFLNNNWGISGFAFYSDNKEIGYKTIENKTVFQKLEDERKLLYRRRIGAAVSYRPNLFNYHSWMLEYHHNSIENTVATELNPDYFLNGHTDLKFFVLAYTFDFDKRVFFQYPNDGYRLFFGLTKEGLGMAGTYNNLPMHVGTEFYIPYKKWILANRIKFKTTLMRNKVAFANNTGLGYGEDVVNGYELYVIDGLDYGLWQGSLKYNIVDKTYHLGKNMPMDQFKKMSVKIFLRFNLSAAYVHEPTYKETNFLNNQLIVGYGPALDIMLWNTFILKAEYSFNELGEHGLVIKTGSVF